MKILKEFKNFAVKGNMIDMGIGIIIGGAFGQIVNSFVKDMVMPPLGVITGNIDFSERILILKKATESTVAITMNYGLFINALLNFLIVSISIFIVIKYINKMRDELTRKEKAAEIEKEETKKKTDPNIELLTEIRDLLKNKSH